MKFSSEIIHKITLYTNDLVVAWVLRNYMNTEEYDKIILSIRRVLIYGEVQSGKTSAIMNVIKHPLYTDIVKIVIIQNSVLVLNQYNERFKNAGIQCQIIEKNTTILNKDVIILMNNKSRYNIFRKSMNQPKRYIVIMDESDSYGSHDLTNGALHEYYVTATPHHPFYKKPKFFDDIQHIDKPSGYQGLHNITIEYDDSPLENIVAKFRKDTKKEKGMMLINSFRRVAEMREVAQLLSSKFPSICFVTLNSIRKLVFQEKEVVIYDKSISNIIDRLKDAPYIVFIAHRMSLRGLSYICSNYNRHITHQYSDINNKSITNSLQRMRLFGIYKDSLPVKLILPSNNSKNVDKMFKSLNLHMK
jgi:hypothetical protein